MLNRLIHAAVHGRVVVLALCAVLLIYGVRTISHAPLDVFPEFSHIKVEVQTEAPGLSTEEVESLVTIPLENALNGTPGIETLRSKSVLGLSSVVLLFKEGTDLERARQYVQERVALEAPRLPTVARPPVILQPLSSLSRVLKITLASDTLNQMDLTELTLWTLRPKLMGVPGVANVAIWGQRNKQFQVLVNPDRLRAHGITLDQVIRAAGDATVLQSGGFVDTPNQRIAVRHREAIYNPSDLERTVVDFRGGTPIRLRDVAQVVIGSPPPIGDAIVNDKPGLMLIVEKTPEGNTLEVTRKLEEAMEQLKPAMSGVVVDTHLFRPATFIEMAIHNLTKALLVGCALVVVILLTFLRDRRTAFISLTAIPLSLVAAIAVLTACGMTLNTMVIAGLVIALGEVVDDAIIDVENIVRRLKLNREAGHPHSAFQVVVDASLEVRSAVVYATMIVMIIFLPVFFLDGIAGAFFRPLALAYMTAILASLLVALTVTPALCYLLLAGNREKQPEATLAQRLRGRYATWLPRMLHQPRKAMLIIFTTFGLSFGASFFYGHEFLPEFQETDFLMHFLGKPGTSVEEMDRLTIRAAKELLAIPGVRNQGAHIGRAEVADEVYGPEFTELWVSIDPDAPYHETKGKIQAVMDGYAGLYTDVQTYLKERSKEVLSGAGASIVVRIYGPDLHTLRTKADEVKHAMAQVAGIADLKVEPLVILPQIEIVMRPETAERYGLTPGLIRSVTTTLLRGMKVGEVYEGQKRYEVVVWGTPEIRADLAAIQALPIDTPTGMPVRLKDVADVMLVPMPNSIKREHASRRIDITANARGRDLGSVTSDVESKVRSLDFTEGYYPEFLGEYEAQKEASRRLRMLTALALIGIILVIYNDFKSWRLTLITTFTLPFALVGSGVAVFLAGGTLSLGSIVGFVTVIGIAARNGIMMVSHYRHLEDVEGEVFGPALVQRGAEERLVPILMTALATGLALLPLIISGAKPGHEVEYPLAVAILGGLSTSTILNLCLLPALYLRFGRRRDNP
jgi:CzcA family heavy metal efflux pump